MALQLYLHSADYQSHEEHREDDLISLRVYHPFDACWNHCASD